MYTSGASQIIGSQVDHDCLKETKQIRWTIPKWTSQTMAIEVWLKNTFQKSAAAQKMQEQLTE